MGNPLILKNGIDTFTTVKNQELDNGNSAYSVIKFTEESDPENALFAQKMQGHSYESANYVRSLARERDGRLLEDIDKARGENVEYYVARNTTLENPDTDSASLRLVLIREDGDLNDLPSFRYSSDSLFPEVKQGLESHIQMHGTASLREVAAVSKSEDGSPLVAYELLKSVIFESMHNSIEHERWLMRFAPKAYKAMTKFFGEDNVARAGRDVEVDDDGGFVLPDVRLVPSVVNPKAIIDTMAFSIANDELDEKTLSARKNAFCFMMDGCNSELLQPETVDCYGDLLKELRH